VRKRREMFITIDSPNVTTEKFRRISARDSHEFHEAFPSLVRSGCCECTTNWKDDSTSNSGPKGGNNFGNFGSHSSHFNSAKHRGESATPYKEALLRATSLVPHISAESNRGRTKRTPQQMERARMKQWQKRRQKRGESFQSLEASGPLVNEIDDSPVGLLSSLKYRSLDWTLMNLESEPDQAWVDEGITKVSKRRKKRTSKERTLRVPKSSISPSGASSR